MLHMVLYVPELAYHGCLPLHTEHPALPIRCQHAHHHSVADGDISDGQAKMALSLMVMFSGVMMTKFS